jgi:hypothetical protein
MDKLRAELFASRDLLKCLRIHIPSEFIDSVDGRIRDIDAALRDASGEGCRCHPEPYDYHPEPSCPIHGHPATPPKEERWARKYQTSDGDKVVIDIPWAGRDYILQPQEASKLLLDLFDLVPVPAQDASVEATLLVGRYTDVLRVLRQAREALKRDEGTFVQVLTLLPSLSESNAQLMVHNRLETNRAALSEIDKVLGCENSPPG